MLLPFFSGLQSTSCASNFFYLIILYLDDILKNMKMKKIRKWENPKLVFHIGNLKKLKSD